MTLGFWQGLSWPITWPLGWACYWLGDGIARLMNIVGQDDWPEWPCAVLYPIYNRLMLVSVWFSDTFSLCIWQPADQQSGGRDAEI